MTALLMRWSRRVSSKIPLSTVADARTLSKSTISNGIACSVPFAVCLKSASAFAFSRSRHAPTTRLLSAAGPDEYLRICRHTCVY